MSVYDEFLERLKSAYLEYLEEDEEDDEDDEDEDEDFDEEEEDEFGLTPSQLVLAHLMASTPAYAVAYKDMWDELKPKYEKFVNSRAFLISFADKLTKMSKGELVYALQSGAMNYDNVMKVILRAKKLPQLREILPEGTAKPKPGRGKRVIRVSRMTRKT